MKSILISSAGPGEGKTTTVANLAITFANLGKNTLLVDTDLRRPVIHSVFNVKRHYFSILLKNVLEISPQCGKIENQMLRSLPGQFQLFYDFFF